MPIMFFACAESYILCVLYSVGQEISVEPVTIVSAFKIEA